MQTPGRTVRAIAIAWSGASADDRRTGVAVAQAGPGRLEVVRANVPPIDAIGHLIAAARRGPIVAGIDRQARTHDGCGSSSGMRFVPDLRREGFSIWPFDDARAPLLVEICPRALRQGRGAAELMADPRVLDELRAAATASEPAVDAAFSALALADAWFSLLALRRAPEGDERRLEGDIWAPG